MGGTISFDDSLVHYLTRVLRLQDGDEVTGFDTAGVSYALSLQVPAPSGAGCAAKVLHRLPPAKTAPVIVTLAQSLPKGPKIDLILRQGTEMGVGAFLPFVSSRTVSRPDPEGEVHKTDRWQKILIEACRQCGRIDVPKLSRITDWAGLLAKVKDYDLALFLYEKEAAPIKSVLESKPEAASILLLIGPEGGWSPEEARQALAAGAFPVHLPTSILRCETAGLAATAMVRFFHGER